MILIGLGSNIDGPWGSPLATMREAIRRFSDAGIAVQRLSALIETAPLGTRDQPNFLNAVARVRTGLGPIVLLDELRKIEKAAGRRRGRRWGPRTLDLDLLDHHGVLLCTHRLVLPHPELANRPFVLVPIAEIAPRWRHPVYGQTAATLLFALRGNAEGAVISVKNW
jgi:2-amino-4-hydroxy-6-hydroxymethyldihydropteridine diphosphokinase